MTTKHSREFFSTSPRKTRHTPYRPATLPPPATSPSHLSPACGTLKPHPHRAFPHLNSHPLIPARLRMAFCPSVGALPSGLRPSCRPVLAPSKAHSTDTNCLMERSIPYPLSSHNQKKRHQLPHPRIRHTARNEKHTPHQSNPIPGPAPSINPQIRKPA